MTAKCVDTTPSPAPRTVCPHLSPLPPLLRYCLQNLVQHFKLTYAFSVWLKFFVIVLTSIDSCIHSSCNHLCFNQTTTYHISTIYWPVSLPVRVNGKEASALKKRIYGLILKSKKGPFARFNLKSWNSQCTGMCLWDK